MGSPYVKPNTMPAISDEISHISLHIKRPVPFHGYVAPFAFLYAVSLYVWVFVYGVEDYFEAGCVVVAAIALLQILTILFCLWFVEVRCALTCAAVKDPFKATLVKVTPTPNNGYTELIPLLSTKNDASGKMDLVFQFQKMRFVYDAEEKKCFDIVQLPDDWSFTAYIDWKGYTEDEELMVATRQYGKNYMVMDIPTFAQLFKDRATAPFFVFQVFCVGLWCLDDYWYYSLFTLFMLVTFEATLVQQQLRNMAEIRKMGNKPYLIQCYRNRRWRPVPSDDLIPGDIVSIGRGQDDRLIPCDLLLIRGSCIVDESMLTGESVPVMKESIEEVAGDTFLNMETHSKLHVLFGGTKIVQHSPPAKTGPGLKAPDNGCIAFVVHHGFNTSQGRLLRTILYGVRQVTANNLETFLFILLLLIFAVAAAVYVWIQGSANPERNRYKLFLECTLILTSVVPPELPIELSLAVNTSLLALSKLYVYCTEPFRIPFAGKVDMCCFDKTGTLTSDNLVVEGVAGISTDGGDTVVSVDKASSDTVQVLATCHSLALLDDHTLVGDPLEKATLIAIDWNVTKGDAVVPAKGRGHGYKIFHRYYFSSALKRMSVVCGYTPPGDETSFWVTVKGAPETLRNMFEVLPSFYDDVYLSIARRGARVLALGRKQLGQLSHQEVRDLTRERCECALEFCGFVIISCPLKPDSKSVVREIQHASHNVIMITGDNPLTACHVAREIEMTTKTHTLVLETSSNEEWFWQSIDASVHLELRQLTMQQLSKEYDLCLTGEGLTYMAASHADLFKSILPYVKVYARVAPKQKEFVITSLKSLGYVTLMCGDGTNDVGALKHAHVGVALLPHQPMNKIDHGAYLDGPVQPANQPRSKITSKLKNKPPPSRPDIRKATDRLQQLMDEADKEMQAKVVRLGDASIAAPFTSKHPTTTCVCHIIKQGRCTLVTTLQMFKILALNALILAYSQSVLYLEGVKFSDTQATVQGLLLAGCFLFISRSKPLKNLSKERPLPNIFNVYTLSTILMQFAVHFCSLVYLYQLAEEFSPPKADTVKLDDEFKPNLINSTVYMIAVAMQASTFAVNYKGRPFMEGLTENKALLYSLLGAFGAVVCLTSGFAPEITRQFEIVDFEPEFRNKLLGVLFLDFLGAFLVDRSLQLLFGDFKQLNV